MGGGGSGQRKFHTFVLHTSADQDHVGECYDYLDQNFTESELPTLIWAVDYIALCLNEGNSWICAQVLGRASG